MAQQTLVQMVDDLSGAPGDDIETVSFGIDRKNLEIDLSADNAAALREALAPFVAAARKASAAGARAPRKLNAGPATGASTAADRERNQEIRTWARANGWPDLADRGRIPFEIVNAYDTEGLGVAELPSGTRAVGQTPEQPSQNAPFSYA